MNIYEEIVKLQREGRRGAVATIVNSRGSIPSFQSAKMLIRDDGSIAGTIGGGCVEAEVWQAAREVIAEEKPRSLTFDLNQDPKYDTGLVCGGTLEIFIEPVLPSSLLYIFGAGHVALELFKAARNAGFECIVADDREAYANSERFPDAVQVVAREFDRGLQGTRSRRVVLHRHRHARPSRRHARSALGRSNPGALHRHGRLQTQSHYRLSRTHARRAKPRALRSRVFARRPRHRRRHARRDRRLHRRRADRRPPPR